MWGAEKIEIEMEDDVGRTIRYMIVRVGKHWAGQSWSEGELYSSHKEAPLITPPCNAPDTPLYSRETVFIPLSMTLHAVGTLDNYIQRHADTMRHPLSK